VEDCFKIGDNAMNILAVGANPDDVEFLCAGTLAVYAKRGDSVSIAFLTTGDKGSSKIPPEEMAAIRQQEAENAAKIIGAKVFPLGIPDGEVEVSMGLRRRIVELIRQTQPDAVITHFSDDYMSDHNYTSQLVVDAGFWAGSKDFSGDPGKSPHVKIIPPIFYMDTLAGIGFVPQEYVDITEVMDIKIEMLSQHKSQLEYMKERDGLDFLDYMKTAARYRGYQCGVKYAEGFIPNKVYPSLSTRRLLP
jgi:N-acetylglucosamine malate deacetylase 1